MYDKTIKAITRTKQFQQLLSAGLQLTSTERQLETGTISLSGKFRRGRKTVTPSFMITASGNVFSNRYKVRVAEGEQLRDRYKSGLSIVSELLSRRLAT